MVPLLLFARAAELFDRETALPVRHDTPQTIYEDMLARARAAMVEIGSAGVSSMKSGQDSRSRAAWMKRRISSSVMLPSRIRCDGTREALSAAPGRCPGRS